MRVRIEAQRRKATLRDARVNRPDLARGGAWRAVDTFWHRYELLPDRLRITSGLYRPNIHTEEVDFDTVQAVRIEGFWLYRIVNRGDVVLDRERAAQSRCASKGIKDPEGIKRLIDGAHERWRPILVGGALKSLSTFSVKGLWISRPEVVANRLVCGPWLRLPKVYPLPHLNHADRTRIMAIIGDWFILPEWLRSALGAGETRNSTGTRTRQTLAIGRIPVHSAEALLGTAERQARLQAIEDFTRVTPIHFETLYEQALRNYAAYVQQLPASEAHHHAGLGGLLDHGLEAAVFALKLRRGHLLPRGHRPSSLTRKPISGATRASPPSCSMTSASPPWTRLSRSSTSTAANLVPGTPGPGRCKPTPMRRGLYVTAITKCISAPPRCSRASSCPPRGFAGWPPSARSWPPGSA